MSFHTHPIENGPKIRMFIPLQNDNPESKPQSWNHAQRHSQSRFDPKNSNNDNKDNKDNERPSGIPERWNLMPRRNVDLVKQAHPRII